MNPFMALPVHVHTFIPINRWDLPVNSSTAPHVHRCTCSSVYLFSLFLPFWHNMHSYLSTHLLGYVHTIILMRFLCLRTNTYLSPQLLVYLPLNVPDHDPACSFSYFYSIRLTAKIYPSTFLLLCMSTDLSVHLYTCSVFLPFRYNIHSYLSAHLLGYVHTFLPGNKFTCLALYFSFV